jgi:hypothetical protein
MRLVLLVSASQSKRIELKFIYNSDNMNRPARDKSPAFEPRYLDNDLNRSVIMPVERKKYIETIEIVEV